MTSLDARFCSDITGLKDFLRASRALVDDHLTLNLNNLVLPTKFDPNSTARPIPGETRVLRAPIDEQSCGALVSTIFRNWQGRSTAIDQCLAFADSTSTVQTRATLDQQQMRDLNKQRRLDPYAGKATDDESILKRVLVAEQGTERIIRDRTWRIVRQRCQSVSSLADDWENAYRQWQIVQATHQTVD